MDHILDLYVLSKKSLLNIEEKKKSIDSLVNTIEKSYREKISALENEMRDQMHAAELNQEKLKEALNVESVPYKGTIDKVKRILEFIKLFMSNPSVSAPEIYRYSDRDDQGNYLGYNNKRKIMIDPIKTIYQDTYNIFNLYIVPNKKPTNKYSLIIRGYTIFGSIMRNYLYGSISGISDSNCNIYINVKDAPTVKELQSYVEKHMDKISNMIPKECISFAKEYEEAIELFNDVRWQIFYWESMKKYYEDGVHNGTEDPEYAIILDHLKQLKTRGSI